MFALFESFVIFIGFFSLTLIKRKKFRKILSNSFLVLFGFILFIHCPFYIEINNDRNTIEPPIEGIHSYPKESGYWLVDHIEIDQNDVLKNWEVINQTYPWCSGSGTITNPYIIENVSINAFNYEIGISIRNSKGVYFEIKNCNIYNASIGIQLYTTDNGAIINNSISYNRNTGILIHNCKKNKIIGNIIQNNSQYGVLLNGPNSKNNALYRNQFIENERHALDNSGSNFNLWYNSSIGNYWDNYTGKDANDDNIGDISYDYISGGANSIDLYPIWWDAPSLKIDFPLNYSVHSKFAAKFKLIIQEGKGDTFWYEIAGQNSSFIPLTGLIEEEIVNVFTQDLWDLLTNGPQKIKFYVNDSKGYIASTDIIINLIIPDLSNWWNVSYAYRAPIKLDNRHTRYLPKGYSVNVSINTLNLISMGKLQSDGRDLRIVWYNYSSDTWIELDRVNETNFNTNSTNIWFKTQRSINPNTYDGNYYLYYGYKDCNNPPINKSKVYHLFDGFTQSDGLAEGWTVINGTWLVDNNKYIETLLEIDGRSLLNSFTIENASIEVRLNSSGGNFGAGIMFRHQNNQNFYTAGIGFWEYEVAIGKWSDDIPYVLDNTSTLESVLNDNQWYNLKIEMLGPQYLVYLNGILKNNITDSDHLIAGQIGLMTWTNSAISCFDDLKVKLLIPNEPLLVLGSEETFKPRFSNLIESSNPLELGDIEIIFVNITDISGIKQALIEFEGINHSMTYLAGDRWVYDQWKPQNTGNYEYMIFSENLNGNWNSIEGSIQVIDTTLPTFLNLIESADPLELGDTEVITINASDISGINQLLIEFEGSNHTMQNIGENRWQYDSWIPLNVGVYPYMIYIEDNNHNWNSTAGAITVEDTISPVYWGLVESADPLELGQTEVISINVSDIAGINQVLIEFEEVNHTMEFIGGDIWHYDSWVPLSIGVYPYIIYIQDGNNNWNSTIGAITVQDTTSPLYWGLIESADPLELGNTEMIMINASDAAGINQVLIEFEGSNHSMTYFGGFTWQYNSWIPFSIGIYPYIINIQDGNDNWNSTSGTITVQDLNSPIYWGLVESADPLELGDTEVISINVSDISGINQVLIEFEEANHTMENIGGNTWQYNSWVPLGIGVYPYIIYIQDGNNNWNSTSGIITVEDTISPVYWDLIESADPLELGETEVISINVSDISGINQVLIEFEGSNHSMTYFGGFIWRYNSWGPSNVGVYSYIIYIEDTYNNWNLTSGTITVEDTISPVYWGLIESADPLELGQTE
ncbi:MAG: NosD domain-containing protein, partial [Candidatus Thorarchaeota archaeon]